MKKLPVLSYSRNRTVDRQGCPKRRQVLFAIQNNRAQKQTYMEMANRSMRLDLRKRKKNEMQQSVERKMILTIRLS